MNEPERRTGGEMDIDAKVGAKFLMAMVGGLVIALLVIYSLRWLGDGRAAAAGDDQPANTAVEGEIAPIGFTVDTGEGEPSEFELVYTPDSTLFELMLAAEEPAFEHRGEGETAFIESIAGVSSDIEAELFWRYYVNGQLANEGFGAYVVQPGDVILWKREKTE